MKKTILATLAFTLGLSTANAQTTQQLGVTIYKYDDNFMTLMRKAIKAEASHYPDLQLLMNDSQNSQTIQNEQVDLLISHGANVLAINLVDPAAAPTIIGKAKLANIPVIFFNKDPGQKALSRYDKAYYVGADPQKSGQIQGDLIAKQWKMYPHHDLNQDGILQYALLEGEPNHPDAKARSKAVITQLNQQGIKTEAVFKDTAKWETALAKQKMTTWLASPKADRIEVVIANNDSMAIGALAALNEQGQKRPIFGVDALPEALSLIKKGELAGTVFNNSSQQSKALVALSYNLANGKAATSDTPWSLNDRTLRIPYIGIDQDNLAELLK